jgi:hypothetical protein
MSLIVQFPDLTEWSGLGENHDPVHIRTEFAFGVAAPGSSTDKLTAAGFQHVSSMNNWWPTHKGQDRELKLYWKKFDDKGIVPELEFTLKKWCIWKAVEDAEVKADSTYCVKKDLAASGCGFKIAQPPLKRISFYRFFSLLRMPLQPMKVQVKWLGANHFRLLDTGTQASFWCNGWKPKEWDIKMEREFFKDFKDPMYDKLAGVYGN